MNAKRFGRTGFIGFLIVAAMTPAASAVVTAGTGGSGVTVGSSGLIEQLDLSDTFTGTPDGSANPARPYAAASQPAPAYVIEDTHGNVGRSWTNPAPGFSFASDRNPTNPGFVNGALNYPGNPAVNENTSGSGSITGFTQTGGAIDYGTNYGLRNKYVVQFDAVQTTDRIDITSASTSGGIFVANGLSVFFRTTGHGFGEIGIFSNGVGETNSGLTSGIAGNTWNNYAVAYDVVNKSVEIFVNEVSRGSLDLTTFAGGVYANFSNAAVSVGGSGNDRVWSDNAQIGSSVVTPGPASLVTYINFDESPVGTGTAFDQVHANNGSFQGTATRTTGLVGAGAARFNSSNADAVNIGNGQNGVNNLFSFNTGITIEALVTSNWDGVSQDEVFRKEDGNNRILFSLQAANNINNNFGQLVGTAGVAGISLGLNINGSYGEMDIAFDGLNGRPTVAQFADGNEHHLAATYDALTGLKSIFLDGVLIGQVTLTGNILSGGAANAFIGSSAGGSEPWAGTIDEFAIYNQALSAEELQQHFAFTQIGLNYFATIPEPGTLSLLALSGFAVLRRRRHA